MSYFVLGKEARECPIPTFALNLCNLYEKQIVNLYKIFNGMVLTIT